MLRRITQRVSPDEGMTVIELMVATFVLSIAVFALLQTFFSTARSVQTQRNESGATRAASSQFEALRGETYEDVDPGTDTVTVGGIPYDLTWTVTPVDPDTSNSTSNDEVKRVDLSVSWNDHGTTRTRSYTTDIGRTTFTPTLVTTPAIGDITFSPTTVFVDEAGNSVEAVDVEVPLTSTPSGTLVQLTWTDDNGSQLEQTTYLSGPSVTFTLPVGRILAQVPATDTERPIEFTATTGAVTKTATLTVKPEPDTPLTLSNPNIDPNVIVVEQPHHQQGCSHSNACRNVEAVTFEVEVQGFAWPDNVDSVNIRYTLWDGNVEEVALVRDDSLSDSTSQFWEVTLPALSVKFDGPASGIDDRTFTFVAIRSSDGTERTLAVDHPVQRQP